MPVFLENIAYVQEEDPFYQLVQARWLWNIQFSESFGRLREQCVSVKLLHQEIR